MSEFDEWFKSLNEGGRTTYFLGQEGNISKEAWDFQQVKIDCMQVRLDGANERALSILNHKNRMVDKMQAEIDGLQGRIDGVVGLLETSFNPSKKNIIDILKGNKDE